MALVLGYIFFMGFDFEQAFEAFKILWKEFQVPIYLFLGLTAFGFMSALAYIYRDELYSQFIVLVNLVISILNWAISAILSVRGSQVEVLGLLN